MYIAHEHPPMIFSIFDVTEPSEPKLLWQLPAPHANVRGNSLALRGDTLLVAYQCYKFGMKPAGFQVYDVSNPVEPREVSFFDVSGPHCEGVHYISFMDGRYAHITTGAPDFEGKHHKDHQFYMIVDLANPSKPTEVGRWWMPGQRKGDDAELPPRHPEPFDFAFRPHHTLVLSRASGPRVHRLHRRRYRDSGHSGQGTSAADLPARLPPAVSRIHPHRVAAVRARSARGNR